MAFTWGKEGSGSLKGPRNGEGGSGEPGPSISRLLNCMLEQAASKACNLHQLNITGRGLAGRENSLVGAWKPPAQAGKVQEWGGRAFQQQQSGQRGPAFCRNLFFPWLPGCPNLMQVGEQEAKP